LLSACGQSTPEVVEKEVTSIVVETVKETVMVEGEAQVVEKEVTKVVEQVVTEVVEKEVEVVVTATPEPEAEQIFRIAAQFDTWSADPAVVANASWTGEFMARASYDPLIVMRGYPYQPELVLAESYEVSDDYTEWTFVLREDAVFHDGSPVTADDVKYSWERAHGLGTDVSAWWFGVADTDSLEVVDERTVRFTLDTPYADFLSTLIQLFIVNADLVRENEAEGDFGTGWLSENEAGSGPFTLETYEPGSQYVYTAVEDYWNGWPNDKHMDKIIVKIMPESTTQKLALQKGDLDWTDMEPEDFKAVQGEPGVETNLRGANSYMIFMNNQEGPTADPNVRKAIAHAFNYDAMLATVVGEKAQGLLKREVPGFVPLDMPDYDIEKAKEYLAQSAYPDGGFELTFVALADYKPEETIGLLLQEGLGELGITVNVVPTEWTQYYELCASPEAAPDMLTLEPSSWWATSQTLTERYSSANWGTLLGCSFYKNEEVDRLLEEIRAKPDDESLLEMDQIQRLVFEDTPMVVMYHYGYKQAYTDRLRGLGNDNHPLPYPPFPQDLYYGE
jgi:peptide/nickel transport system substrate-binding protein